MNCDALVVSRLPLVEAEIETLGRRHQFDWPTEHRRAQTPLSDQGGSPKISQTGGSRDGMKPSRLPVLVPRLARLFVHQPHGPVIAKVIPGVWMLTKSHLPSGLNTAPAHSCCRASTLKVTPDSDRV